MSTYGSLVLTDTTYSGEAAGPFIRQAVVGAEIVDGGHVYVKDGIYKKYTIPRMSFDDMVQDYAAKPVTSGITTITGAVLEPERYMIYLEFDPQDFKDHWFAPEMQSKLIGRSLPNTVEAGIITSVLEYHQQYLGKAFIMSATGGTAPYNKFGGFLQKALNDATVLDVAGVSATTLTSSNIVTELEKVYAKIPKALLFDPNYKLFVSYATAGLYSDYQIAQTNKGVDVTSFGSMTYKGKKIVPLAFMRNNTIMGAKGTAGLDSNLWIGINSNEDATIQLGKLQANSDLWFVKILYAADTQFGFGSEVVLYYGA